MVLGFLGSGKFKWGLIGALAGAAAPIFFFLLQPSIKNSGALLAFGIALLSSWALGVGGLIFGHLRDRDHGYRQKMELREKEVSVLESLSEAMTSTKNLDSLLYSALRETVEFSFLNGLTRCAAFVKEPQTGQLRLAAKIDRDARPGSFDKEIEAWKSLGGIAADTGEMVICPDASKDERVPSAEPKGYVAVPLKSSDKVLGVMVYCLPANCTPTFEEAKPLFAAASQICSFAENLILSGQALIVSEDMAKNEQTLAKKVAQLNSLVEVDRIILSTMDRDEMLHKVSVQIRSLVPADLGGVALCDPETGDYRYIGGWGMEVRNREILQTSDWLGSPVLNRGKPMTRKNIDDDVILSPFDKLLHEMGVRSDLYAPIIRRGKTVGIFFLGCFREGAFNMEDVDTSVVFASRMGLALEHVRLIYDLDEMSVNIIHALASAIDAKSSWTKGHSERVSDYSLAIAERMGMAKREIERLRLAGLLHDIGKIGTYDVLLDKSGRLTDEEWELIKLHPSRGCEILEPITEFRDILPAVRHHHERWDGTGYPSGLRGEAIPLMARILTVADSFDTMTADRPYRSAIGVANAIQEIRYCTGTQFAPDVADVFLRLVTEKGADLNLLRQHTTQRSVFPTLPGI
jgi:putative nucleotidyltransferase with HDIG domain